MKILIAEDSEDSRVLLDTILEASGYEVESAENGQQALERIDQGFRPDLIISDILMPKMDGYALCRAIKQEKRLSSIPFIFYTATYTDPRDQAFAMSLGATRFLIKPMEMKDLLKEIKMVLLENDQETPPQVTSSLKSKLQEEQNYAEVLTRKLTAKVLSLEEEREKLRHSEQKYRRLVEALRQDYFFYSHDPDGIFTYLSPSISTVLGYSPHEFLTHYSEYLTDNPINEEVIRHTKLSCQGVKQPSYELEILHKDGGIRRLEVTEEPIFAKDGSVIAIEGIAHDISEKIALEKQLRQAMKMEAVGTLAGGIAHDFNNILSAIQGYGELANMRVAKHELPCEELKQIMKASHRATELVKQILSFSHQGEEELKPLQLHLIIGEVLNLLRSSLPTSIRLKRNISRDCGLVLADPTQIHQVLMNLCTNAKQAMEDQNGTLTVSIAPLIINSQGERPDCPHLIPGNYILLKVSDTGKGMAEPALSKIFDPFFTTKKRGEGTGLGLSVVHGIIKKHHGEITVHSAPDQGTCFHIYLPVIDTKTSESEGSSAEGIIFGNNEQLLVVDDERVIVDILQRLLTSLGYRVTGCTNSVEALDIYRKNPEAFDLVITDMTMPDLTGTELIKKLQAIRPNLPIILCTGFSEQITKTKAAALGVRAFIMKPVLKYQLAAAIRASLT